MGFEIDFNWLIPKYKGAQGLLFLSVYKYKTFHRLRSKIPYFKLVVRSVQVVLKLQIVANAYQMWNVLNSERFSV